MTARYIICPGLPISKKLGRFLVCKFTLRFIFPRVWRVFTHGAFLNGRDTRRMARKTMPATRKRRDPSLEPALAQQEQENLAASTSASAAAAVDASNASPSDDPSSPCAHIPSPPDDPSFHPSSSHAHGYERCTHGDIQNKRKRLHACKRKKQVPQLIEEMCKVLTTAGSFHEGNALATSYGSDCNLQFGAKKSASIQDFIGSLTNLSAWMDNAWPRVNAEYCVNHCLNNINCTNATETLGAVNKHNRMQSKVLTNPKDLCLLTPLQLEMIKKALYQLVNEMEERSNLDMGLFGHTLLNAFLNSSGSTCKKKRSWVGNVSREPTNLVSPNRKDVFVGQEKYSTKSNKPNKVQTRSGSDVHKERPADFDLRTTQPMSPGELESWIVKHSLPSKERKHEIVVKPRNLEKIDKDFLEITRDNHIEIEVDLSERDGSLLENEAATTDGISNMLYVKHIMKTISLNRVNLDGQDDVIVLFKALRSDGKEIIVDNAYLRSTYPLLLATFYEQKLRFLVGKSWSGKMR